jgi:hypothetical protein
MQKIVAVFLTSISLLVLFTAFQPAATTTLTGAWGYGPADNRTVMICSGNVFSVATYDIAGKKFSSSYGGTWQVKGNHLLQKIEWNSTDSTTVGKEFTYPINVTTQELTIDKQSWKKLDDGGPGELAGAWIITGTYNNDKVSKRASPFFPRRTMKVLSGKYFHWIAYHITNKQFINAGGGTYTTVNGKYTENIEFFTKTAESVGKSLSFDYSFVNGDWRHKGEKSTGGAMDECWTRRETLEK